MFLEEHLSARLAGGGKIFVPYLTAGLPDEQSFIELVGRISETADVIEIGIPFSDPIMDGPVIQDSSMKALEQGVTVGSSLALIERASKISSCPLVVMTYFNLIHHMGHAGTKHDAGPAHNAGAQGAVARLEGSGVTGLIVPDLPFEEGSDLTEVLTASGIARIQMVAPSTSSKRAATIASASRGWLYAATRMGVTGEQTSLAEAAAHVVDKVRAHCRVPILLGIGISDEHQAQQAAELADGVIVGSAIVRLILDGDADGAVSLAQRIRRSLDQRAS